MSLTMLSIVIVLSSVGSVSSSTVAADDRWTLLSRLGEGPDPGAPCEAADEDAGQPLLAVGEIRSVLRSVQRLPVEPSLRASPSAPLDRVAVRPPPLPVAAPLPLPAPAPAPIWPSARFITRSASSAAATAANPRRDRYTPNDRRLDLTPSIRIQTVYPAQTSVGRSVRLTLAVSNIGTTAASELRIRTTLPEQAVFVDSHPEPSAAEEGVLRFDLGDLAAGDVRRIDLELVPRTAGPVEVKTIADFSIAARSLIRIGRPQLALACQAPQAADLGTQVRYRLVVRNTGDGVAEQVVVEPQIVAGAGSRPSASRRFPVGDLPPGESREIILRDVARRAESLQVRFFASDRNGSEAAAEVQVTVRRPAVEVSFAGPDEITLGDAALFEIRATNTGSGAAEPVRVACSVGDGLRLTVVDQQVQFASKPGQLTWAIGRLAGGETRVLRFQARPVTAGEHLIRAAVENAAMDSGRDQRPAAAEKAITVRDRAADERTASL